MFHGSITALITPFKNGRVDEDALRRFVDWQITEGTHGLVPTGTTGESPTLDHEEHKRVVEITIEAAKGRVPVMAGTGSNSTAEAIELSQHAEKAGASGLLVVAPTTTSPPRKASISTTRRSTTPLVFRSSSTTFLAAPWWTSPSRPWRACSS